ncbi:MAG: copper chaperone PCu(A)C [Alphaproteobacteria bacterium]
MKTRLSPIPLLVFAVLAANCSDRSHDLVVSDAWMRSVTQITPAGGYFKLRNTGPTKVSLTGAHSPACGMLMMHESTSENGMTSMKGVDRLDIPPGGAVRFAPDGYHLMCMNPTPDMKPGAHVDITLEFADHAPLTSSFSVRGAAG